jgi:very-short-patch-repair endonuclease
MPRRSAALPPAFDARPFAASAARRAGVTEGRLRAADLAIPFSGVRARSAPADVRALIEAYLPKMAPAEFFSHRTAALLHGMWLPFEQAQRLQLDVAVRPPARAPRDAGVSGHHLVDRPGLVMRLGAIRVADPVETWCQLATLLAVPDLVAAGDSLLAKGRPDVQSALGLLLAADEERPRHGRLIEAAALLRGGVRSAQESKLRLLLVGAGLPEPEVNGEISSRTGEFVAESDLVYRRERVLVEYEGDYHRTDRAKWRSDIVRYERLQDLGWRIIRVTADDLALRPAETVARVGAALAARR